MLSSRDFRYEDKDLGERCARTLPVSVDVVDLFPPVYEDGKDWGTGGKEEVKIGNEGHSCPIPALNPFESFPTLAGHLPSSWFELRLRLQNCIQFEFTQLNQFLAAVTQEQGYLSCQIHPPNSTCPNPH